MMRDPLTLKAAAYACAPCSWAHFEPLYREWRRRNPGAHFPLGVGLHCPTFWVIDLTDMAGTA
jgi:hypothetical protein